MERLILIGCLLVIIALGYETATQLNGFRPVLEKVIKDVSNGNK